ncbi:MAG: flagellar M-ring protein FliF [Nocardioidaceae bacterium]|nr:flagellar M-ring protein FliF [Nocardioidaceae bacterium]
MRDQIVARLTSLQRSFASFTAGQKTIAVIGALALVLGGFMVFRWASAPSYAPLFTSMAPADASAVVDKLTAAGTPYQLTDGGTTVLVPENDVYGSRIKLSGEGLPSSDSQGYGLLDKQGLSTSQFQEQTSYKRAIEGELQKTIEALDAVDAAVVHVAMPQQTLFATTKQPTTASVLVQTHPGATLDSTQVQAIVHLVASSVPGLDPSQVTVSDTAGTVLSAAGDSIGAVGDTRAQQVKQFEDQMNTSVSDLLTKIVGPGNSGVDVTANLSFDKTLTNTTRYFTNPKVPALSASTSKETYKGAPNGTTGGVVGPSGQLSPSAAPTGAGSSYVKTDKTADNAVGSVVEHKEAAPGNVQSLHVGIVLDTQALAGRTPGQIQNLVASALGINPKRGDTVTVTSMPFDRTQQKAAAAELAAEKKAAAHTALMSEVKTGGIVLVVAVVLLLAWLRGRKRRKVRDQATTYVVEQLKRGAEQSVALPPNPPAMELPGPDASSQLRMAARDEIAAMVERQPEEVAQLLRGWLVEAER